VTDERRQAGTDAETDARVHDDVQAYTLTVDDAADVLGKSVDTVRRYIRQGKLPHIRVQGGRTVEYRLRPDDVRDLRDRQEAVEAEPATATADPPPPAAATEARPEGRVQAGTDARMQMLTVVQSLVQPLVNELHQTRERTEQLAAENAVLRERLRVAEQERREIRRFPWWVRLFLGR